MGTFITVGNGTQSFARLLDAVSQIHHQLPQPVTVQTGHNEVDLPGCTVFKFTDQDHFRRLIHENELIITHGGVGTILTALDCGRRPVIVPRRAHLQEIANDHQMTLVREMVALDLIHTTDDETNLGAALLETIARASSLTVDSAIIAPLRSRYLQTVGAAFSGQALRATDKICLVSAAGGHLTELRKLMPLYQAQPYFHVLNNSIVESADMKGKTYYLTLCERDWRGILNFFEAARILLKERPRLIVSTGAWPAIPFAIVGRLLGIPNIYVETMAVVDRPTMTGKAMYHLASFFYYPWRQLASAFPKGTYCGILL